MYASAYLINCIQHAYLMHKMSFKMILLRTCTFLRSLCTLNETGYILILSLDDIMECQHTQSPDISPLSLHVSYTYQRPPVRISEAPPVPWGGDLTLPSLCCQLFIQVMLLQMNTFDLIPLKHVLDSHALADIEGIAGLQPILFLYFKTIPKKCNFR